MITSWQFCWYLTIIATSMCTNHKYMNKTNIIKTIKKKVKWCYSSKESREKKKNKKRDWHLTFKSAFDKILRRLFVNVLLIVIWWKHMVKGEGFVLAEHNLPPIRVEPKAGLTTLIFFSWDQWASPQGHSHRYYFTWHACNHKCTFTTFHTTEEVCTMRTAVFWNSVTVSMQFHCTHHVLCCLKKEESFCSYWVSLRPFINLLARLWIFKCWIVDEYILSGVWPKLYLARWKFWLLKAIVLFVTQC